MLSLPLTSPYNAYQRIDISADKTTYATNVLTLNTDYTYVQGNVWLILETPYSQIKMQGDDITVNTSGTAGTININSPMTNLNSPTTYFAGNLNLSDTSGIKFGTTYGEIGLGAGSSKTLDDYEEGTWTPKISFDTGNGSINYQTVEGKYIKIGKHVKCYGTVSFNSSALTQYSTVDSNGVVLEGLPFACATGTQLLTGYPNIYGQLFTTRLSGYSNTDLLGNPWFGVVEYGATRIGRIHFSNNDGEYITLGNLKSGGSLRTNFKWWFQIDYLSQ